MPRFCANCGIDEGQGVPIIDNLCLNCYIKIKELIKVPTVIDVHTCSRCGAILVAGRWYYPEDPAEAVNIITKIVESSIRLGEDVSVKSVEVEVLPSPSQAHVKAELLIKNRYSYLVESNVNIKWVKQLCPVCFKRVGKGFDAVVQVRFIHLDDNVGKLKDLILRMFHDYLVEVEEVSNGFDIKVSSPNIARRIADLVKKSWRIARVVESYGDVKRTKGGSRKAKLYISVKVINLRVGDYVVLNGKAYTVAEVNDRFVTVVDSNGFKRFIDVEELTSIYERSRSKAR